MYYHHDKCCFETCNFLSRTAPLLHVYCVVRLALAKYLTTLLQQTVASLQSHRAEQEFDGLEASNYLTLQYR